MFKALKLLAVRALSNYLNPIIFIVAADPEASRVEYRNPGTPKKVKNPYAIASAASPALAFSYLYIDITVTPRFRVLTARNKPLGMPLLLNR